MRRPAGERGSDATPRRQDPAGKGRWLFGVVVAALMALMLAASGCQVTTDVQVTAAANGSGTVAVTVTLDRAADDAVGGLQRQLQTGDLAAQGWRVGLPVPVAGGGATVTATHTFASPAALSSVVASIAGSKTDPLFRLRITRRHTLWRDRTTVEGQVDLRCRVMCFGDQALAGLTGSPVGFDANALATAGGTTPAQALRFAVRVTVPGSVEHADATARTPGGLEWQAPLGQRTLLTATTTITNTGAVTAAVVAVAVVALVIVALVGLLWRRRRRRSGPRPVGAHSQKAGADRV